PGGGAVVSCPERGPGLERNHERAVRAALTPRRYDEKAPAHRPRREVGAPGIGPVLVGECRDAKVARRREAELGEPVEIVPHARLERARRDRLGEERAQRGAAARPLLLDDAERAQLPCEVGQPFGEVAGAAGGELPVARARARLADATRPPRA